MHADTKCMLGFRLPYGTYNYVYFNLHIQNRGFESDMSELENPFGLSTDTSALSSLPLEDNGSDSSSHGYAMGPVLRAMLEEWDKGDELLDKNNKKKKKTKDKKPVNKKEEDMFLY